MTLKKYKTDDNISIEKTQKQHVRVSSTGKPFSAGKGTSKTQGNYFLVQSAVADTWQVYDNHFKLMQDYSNKEQAVAYKDKLDEIYDKAHGYRELFNDKMDRKEEFEDTNERSYKLHEFTSEQIEALRHIYKHRLLLVGEKTSAFDNIFVEDTSDPHNPHVKSLEWIINHPAKGYFYVNNEGYKYSRYSIPLSKEVIDEISKV